MNCFVCCEKFNNSNHLAVICKGCEGEDIACRTCCQSFIISKTSDPICMFCKSPWDREFMNKNLTKKFVNNELKSFYENIFVERQISLLPDTQKDAIKEKKIRDLAIKISEANIELNRIKKKLHDQQEIIRSYNLEIYRTRSGNTLFEQNVDNFSVKCPSEKCNGFLDSKYFCTLCEIKYCKLCMEVKNENHVCNEDTKASIQAIKKEAKSCPGCGCMISKIDGCDQMWCVKCHIQFSWKTGEQLKGYNHNPEYFRWMRETGQRIDRNPEENRQIMCGVVFNDNTITDIISNIFHNNKIVLSHFQYLYRFYRHVQYRMLNINGEDNENQLKTLRVKYLLGDITKDQWKISIQQIDKKTKKNIAYNNIWRLVQTVITSYMEQIITLSNENSNRKKYIDILDQAKEFKNYINDSFLEASKTFNSASCPGIDEYWREIYNYKKYIKEKNK